MAATNPIEVNGVIEEEARRCLAALKAEQIRLGINVVSGELSNIKFKQLKKDATGIFTRIRFTFPRYGVFVHKGASRGHGGSKGSKWVNVRGITIHTNPASFGKMNTGSRQAKEWFNPVIENFTETLNVRLTDYFVSIAYSRLAIK
jgi:hypothetical protein